MIPGATAPPSLARLPCNTYNAPFPRPDVTRRLARHVPPRRFPTPTTSARVHGRRDACLTTLVAPLVLPRLARASLVEETAAERAFASVSKSIVRVARVAQNGETTSVGSGFVWYVDDNDAGSRRTRTG